MGAVTRERFRMEVEEDGDQGFPHHVLEGCETALVVFAAAFRGRNDAYWINQAGVTATCVDIDELRLDVMSRLYPDDWEFICADAYTFPATTLRQWDVVTLDPFTNQFQACADRISDWCGLARHAVVLGTGTETIVTAPDGWRVAGVRKRSDYDGGVFWTVLERT